MNTFYDLKHGRRLKIIFAVSLIGVTLSLGIFFNGLVISLTDLKHRQSKSLSDAALGVVKQSYVRAIDQDVAVATAKALALDTLRAMKFGQTGYYWVNDGDGILLMHPYKDEYVDTNVLSLEDKNGVQMFKEFIKVSKEGGGLVHYYWPKPNSQDNYPKISYVVFFEPWNWVIGTGLYTDELEKEIQSYGYRVVGIAFAFAIFFALASLFLTRKLVAELKYKAIKDPLTSLYSRRYLHETIEDLQLKIEREQDLSVSVLFMDIDHFKVINDGYGHSQGDLVLAHTGLNIRKNSRPNDICVRYGGEEFVALTLSSNAETPLILAERICQAVSSHIFKHDKKEFSITLSVGIAHHRKDETIEQTIDRADKLLYQAKKQGRDRIVQEQDKY